MKKICIISPSSYPLLKDATGEYKTGGAEAQLQTLGLAFAERGLDVHYIVDDFGQPDTEKIGNVTTHKVPLKYMGGPNYHLPGSWLKLWQVLRKIQADFHLIKLPRNLLLPLGLFCKLHRKKLIFIGQIDTDVMPEFIKENENIISYWFFRMGLLGVDHVVAQNQFQFQGFQREYNKKATIIKNVLTLPGIGPHRKENFILWVGNSLPKKQPDKFVELAKRLPQFQFKMIMELKARQPDDSFITKELPLLPNLEYLGFVPFSRILIYFQTASLYVSTSTREGFPNTFLQSWQYATPVVSLHVDPDEAIKKFDLGKHSSSFEKLCSDVSEMMGNSELRKSTGINAVSYVEKYHAPDVVVAEYLELFTQMGK